MTAEDFNREVAEFMGEMRNWMKNSNALLESLPCKDKNFCPASPAAIVPVFNWRKWALGCVCIGLGIGASLSVGWQGVASIIKIVAKT